MAQHTLIARKVQTSQDTQYQSYECNPYIFYCNGTQDCHSTNGVQDLEIGRVPCPRLCPGQKICLKPDEKECTIGNSSNGENPLRLITWDEKAPKLLCTFDLDKIDRADQIDVYKQKFGEEYLNTLMSAFCGKHVSSNCAAGLGGECSRYTATDAEGKLCRSWLASLPPAKADVMMRDYCLENNTVDCKCLNRTADAEYDKIKGLSNYFNDNCWYKPCANADSIYLVTNSLKNQSCPTNICQQIIDAEAQGNVTIEGNTSQINCNFGGGGNDNGGGGSDNPSTTTIDFLTWIKEHWQIVMIAAAIVIVVLFL